jgi:hypothetical protein
MNDPDSAETARGGHYGVRKSRRASRRRQDWSLPLRDGTDINSQEKRRENSRIRASVAKGEPDRLLRQRDRAERGISG